MESNRESDFKALNILAYALMGGLAMFMAVVYFLISTGQSVSTGSIVSPQTDLLIVGGFGIMCMTMSRFVSGKVLAGDGGEKPEYPEAIMRYRSSKIVRLALLEGPGLMATVFALVSGNLNLLLIAGFLLGVMWMARPSEAEFSEWWG